MEMLMELPVDHEVGILGHRLFQGVTAGLQRREIVAFFRPWGILVYRHGPCLLEVIPRVVIDAEKGVVR